MTKPDDTTPTPEATSGGSTADSLKRALAMKRDKAQGQPGAPSVRQGERDAASRAAALSKPAYRKASKRG